MKKLIALCMVLVLSATALCACSNGEENKENTTSTESSTEEKTTSTEAQNSINLETEVEKTTSTEVQNSINIEDVDLFDLSFELDGVVYTLPCDFSEFEKNGWSLTEDSKKTIEKYKVVPESKRTIYYCIEKDNGDDFYNEVCVSFINPTSDEKEIMSCQIGGFQVNMNVTTEGLEMGPAVKFPGGLSIDRDLKYDDVIAEYGEPDEFSESSEYERMRYYKQVDDYRKGVYMSIRSKEQTKPIHHSLFELFCDYHPEKNR